MTTYRNLKTQEFVNTILADPQAVLVDVRTEAEYKSGFIQGAVNIPATNKDQLLNMDKSRNYYLHCRIGGRSAMACHMLASNGFENLVNLNGTFDELEEQLRGKDLKTAHVIA